MRLDRVCRCTAYDFPHRIDGGRCTGAAWAESYYRYEGTECDGCNCDSDEGCEVGIGKESIFECQVFETDSETRFNHPMEEEDLLNYELY